MERVEMQIRQVLTWAERASHMSYNFWELDRKTRSIVMRAGSSSEPNRTAHLHQRRYSQFNI